MGNHQEEEAYEDDSDLDSDEESSEENEDKPPTTVVTIGITNKKTEHKELFRVLLDTGTNRCMGTQKAIECAGLTSKEGREHSYITAVGTFTTTRRAKIRAHNLLELNSKQVLQRLKVQVTEGELGIYDFIFGQDYMSHYGIDLLFSQGMLQWDGMRVAMK